VNKTTIPEACDALGINLKTYYNWKNDKKEIRTQFIQTPEENYHALAVLSLVIAHPKWGGERIALELLKESFCVLDDRDAIRLKKEAVAYVERYKLGKKKPIRYEFQEANNAWCMDIKELISNGEKYYLFKIIDDRSRFDLAHSIVKHATTEAAVELIKATINTVGIAPSVFKTDRGPQFKACLKQYLTSINVIHVKSIPYFPKCNAKMERVFLDVEKNVCEIAESSIEKQALAKMIAIEALEHNFVRPHSSLGGLTPGEVYYGAEEYIKGKMAAFCDSVKKTSAKIKDKLFGLVAVDEFIPGSKCSMTVKVFE